MNRDISMKTLLRKRLSAKCNILSIDGAHYEYQMKRQHKIHDQYIYRCKVECLSLVLSYQKCTCFVTPKVKRKKKTLLFNQ